METLMEPTNDVLATSLEFRTADNNFQWCDARIFELQTARKLLEANDPRVTEVNHAIDLLFAERARLLGEMQAATQAF
jgi:hypothetical protein